MSEPNNEALAVVPAAQPPARQLSGSALEKLIVNGDLGKLTPRERVQYCLDRCSALGLDPASQPFGLLNLQGKQVLYALKSCTDQLSARNGLSRKLGAPMVDREGGIVSVTATVTDREGRSVDDIGVVSLEVRGGGLKSGEELANAIMKAGTKAGRRAVLAYAGLGSGVLDETELDTVTGAKTVPFTYDVLPPELLRSSATGEQVLDEENPAHWLGLIKEAKTEEQLLSVWRSFRQASSMMGGDDKKAVRKAYEARQEAIEAEG